jgi:hypothetical protein
MVQLSATKCNCSAILWVSLVSFVAITICVASQRVFIYVVYLVIASVRKLLDVPSYAVPFFYQTMHHASDIYTSDVRAAALFILLMTGKWILRIWGKHRFSLIGGFESRQGLGIFLFISTSGPALGPTQPPIQWVPWTLCLGVKQPGHEADQSPPSSAEVKGTWSYTSTPPYVFMACCLDKDRDNSNLLTPWNYKIHFSGNRESW